MKQLQRVKAAKCTLLAQVLHSVFSTTWYLIISSMKMAFKKRLN